MDDQDKISLEKLRVGPELMRQVLEQQAHKSKRKGWQRVCTVVPRGWELRLLEAKRVSTSRNHSDKSGRLGMLASCGAPPRVMP